MGAKAMPECPDGRDDCLFEEAGHCRSDMYFPPIYDKHGNNTNSDRNPMWWRTKCQTCGREWSSSQVGGDPVQHKPKGGAGQ